MRRRAGPIARALRPLAAAAIIASAAVACVSDAPMAPPADFEIDCASDAQPPAGSGQAVVRIRNFAFAPDELTVAPGTEVVWVNCEGAGGAAHTSTSDDGVWDSGLLAADEGQFARTFGQTGRFDYHCTPHPFMQAAVVVQ